VKDDIGPIDCNITAEIRREIENINKSIPIDDIVSLNVDLIHRWYDHQDCQAEKTRINILIENKRKFFFLQMIKLIDT
jgi:hypothetical protein